MIPLELAIKIAIKGDWSNALATNDSDSMLNITWFLSGYQAGRDSDTIEGVEEVHDAEFLRSVAWRHITEMQKKHLTSSV